MRKRRAPAVKKEQQENLMYLGPTIIGVVRHSTIFKNGVLPREVTECIEQLPVMRKLFVVTEESPATMKELSKEQSVLKTIYSQVSKKFK